MVKKPANKKAAARRKKKKAKKKKAKKKKAKKKKAKKKKAKKKKAAAHADGNGYGRTSKDGSLIAVNIYIHRTLLKRLDQNASTEQRSRRRQLQIELCKAFALDPSTL